MLLSYRRGSGCTAVLESHAELAIEEIRVLAIGTIGGDAAGWRAGSLNHGTIKVIACPEVRVANPDVRAGREGPLQQQIQFLSDNASKRFTSMTRGMSSWPQLVASTASPKKRKRRLLDVRRVVLVGACECFRLNDADRCQALFGSQRGRHQSEKAGDSQKLKQLRDFHDLVSSVRPR